MTPLDEVLDILDMFKTASTVFASSNIPVRFCKNGVLQASISLEKDFPVIYQDVDDGTGTMVSKPFINAEITPKELYVCGLYAYRNFAVNQHDELTIKAMNFKTISFAISGLTERAKEAMRVVTWCDREISTTLMRLNLVKGTAEEMVGVVNEGN